MLSMEEVYQRHAQTVYRYLLSRTGDGHTAEELTQETFFQAVRSAEKFDGSCAVVTWLCGIAKNVLRTYRRKHPATQDWDEAVLLSPSPEETVAARDEHLMLLRQMHALSEEVREVLYLRLLGGLSFREIGDIMGRTENWARVTFYRGREKLRKELTKNGD